ncbi:MAG: alginate lyase family protein, partial [Phycisphaeraceae bacterium]
TRASEGKMQRRHFIKSAMYGVPGVLASGGLGGMAQAYAITPKIQGNKAFTHPGLLHDERELAFIKKQIESGDEPWLKVWGELKQACNFFADLGPDPRREVVRGPSNKPDIGGTEFSRDSAAAYAFALAWQLSGDKAYARKAVDILNAWSATLKRVDGHDTKLLIGMMGIKYVNAAELLRYSYDGWQREDQSRFKAMLREQFYEPIKDFYPTANGNWDASMIQTMLAMGVYLDDHDMFDRAASYYREGGGNGAITNYFNEFGQCQETGRDQGHTQMGLSFLSCACEMAWKQGVDLYAEADNRLALGFEYTAKYNLGNDVRYEPYKSVEGRYHYRKISAKGRGDFAPIYRRLVYHYHHRLKMDMPFSRQAAEADKEGRSLKRGWAYFRWTDLMFVRPPGE